MDQETIEQLKTLDASKRVIVVLFKWRYPFFTNLEAMKKPQDAALIGYFARQIQPKLTNEQLAHFDKVLWFDADYGDFARVYVNSDETKVPQIEEFVKELVEVVSPTKLHLLETEEFMIHPVAALRQKYGIPGPTNADLTRLRDKQWLKEHAATHSLPSAKFIVFDGSQKNSAVTSAEKIEAIIGSYPMFAKPIHGVGGGGGGRIDGRAQLDEWVAARENDEQTYLIEEYVEGREFWAVFALLQSGERRLLYLIHLPADQSMHASLSAGRPIAYIGLNVKDMKFEFPGIKNFLDDVITAFDPPHPHIFCIQGFQTKPAAHEYKLTELAYRINGARGTGISYNASGVSLETALLMCHLDPDYQAEPDSKHNCNIRHITVWYPKIEGILVNQTSLPATLTSEHEIKWYAQPGEKMKSATSVADFICSAHLAHQQKETLMKEADYLRMNWTPEVQ